ncbi:MAG: DUF932 domain-containing protein [Phycisphaera sp. RhM]|nr:DUF932 domain-containing protein [Phycisphaera sp. RhM]
MSERDLITSFDGTKVADPFFPVELCKVQYAIPSEQVENSLKPTWRDASRHYAVVDVERKDVFAMVTQEYDLVTNEQATEIGRECFETVFELTDVKQMDLYNTVMPKTRSFCHMDFVHSKAQHDYFDNDPWTPFLRITNSYNKTKLLQFDLGFCRGVCRNGLIFGKESIVFKRSHSRSTEKKLRMQFALKRGTFAKLESEFRASLVTLNANPFPRGFMWPLVCKVFDIKRPSPSASAKTKDNFERRRAEVKKLTERYFDELGDTGYAALNVLTDYASRPPVEVSPDSRVNALQIASGIWMEDFSRRIGKPDFSFADYLGSHLDLAT